MIHAFAQPRCMANTYSQIYIQVVFAVQGRQNENNRNGVTKLRRSATFMSTNPLSIRRPSAASCAICDGLLAKRSAIQPQS
jgi:hypothetical protein